ncbi:DUF2989 domain-containing protein [Shewanella sp. GXUN23E]|uniref:DUF2989 domain-containing protein n=1 Tax=Shewanella sp. GXUN23E TaxID=3422498 RepID=UPI003D7EA37B
MKGRAFPPKIVIFTPFLLICSLSACDWGQNGTKLCKNNPELCADLHEDAWCWQEKSQLIDARYASTQTPLPEGKTLYLELLALESYNRCIEVASGVQHVINTERTHERAKAFSDSANTLSQLQQKTRNSDALFIAYYHWARFGDAVARDKVLTAASDGRLNDALLLGAVGAYYEKFDPERSRDFYFRAMSRASDADLDPNWLLGIARTASAQRQYRKAYLFTRANVILADHKVKEDQMLLILHGDTDDIEQLDTLAQALADTLADGEYATSLLRAQVEKF